MAMVQTEAEQLIWVGRDSVAPEVDSVVAVPEAPLQSPRLVRRPQLARATRRRLAAIALAGVMATGTVAGSIVVAWQQYGLNAARQAVIGLQGQNSLLAAQVAELQNPARIEADAVQQMGMQRPAGYSPVAVLGVPSVAPTALGGVAEAVLPLPVGPAPGGIAALTHVAATDFQALWQRVHG